MIREFSGIILFFVALVLAVVLLPIGLLSGIFLSNANSYLFMVSLSIDQLGNVVCRVLFDMTLIKHNKYYAFGNPDDTISYVIGRNKLINNLTTTGKILDDILNFIDPGHTEMAVQRAIKIKKIRTAKK